MTPRAVTAFILCLLATSSAVAQGDSAPVAGTERPKVAVVLGGGGAHGIAHIGVLRELEKQQVPIDLIVGTGFGGVIGGLYASGMPTTEIESFLYDTDWEHIFNPDTRREDLSFRRKSDDQDFFIKYRVGVKDGQAQLPRALVPNGRLGQLLQATTAGTKGIERFDDLPVSFRSVAMDLVTGEQVVLDAGSLDRAILATMTAPGTLPPVDIGGRQLISGGLINNLPVDVAREWGADVVIVVDVGIYIRTEDDLTSIFSIVDQVTHLLQRRNSDASISTLRDSDILIRPPVTTSQETRIERPDQRIEKGIAGVATVADRLSALRIADEQYARMTETRVSRAALSPVISAVELVNDSDVDDALILAQLRQSLNEPLEKDVLNEDLKTIYGLGEFKSVEFNLLRKEKSSVLQVRTLENSGGRRFWRFGVSLQDDLEGNSAYTGSASMTWTSLNKLGGEWRNVFRIGEVQQLNTEFYQPLTRSGRYFASISADLRERNVNAFDSGNIVGQVRVEDRMVQLKAGRIFGNSGQVAVGILRGDGKNTSNIGANLPEGEFDIGGYTASAAYDTYDNIYFPHRGTRASLGWVGQRESVGATFDIDIVTSALGVAKTWGHNTLIGGFTAKSQLEDTDGVQNLVQTGGLFQLSGYQRDELSGRHTFVGRGIYFRQLGTNPLRGFLDASVYVGASLEVGNAWQTTDDVGFDNTITAGSLFLGADTFVGPIYLAGGLAEGGQSALYLYLGRPF